MESRATRPHIGSNFLPTPNQQLTINTAVADINPVELNVLESQSTPGHCVNRILFQEYKPTISPALLSAVEKVSAESSSPLYSKSGHFFVHDDPSLRPFQQVVGHPGLLPNNGPVQPPVFLSGFQRQQDQMVSPCCSADVVAASEDVYNSRPVSPLRGRGRPPLNPTSDGAQRSHTCPYCPKCFPNKSALLKHMLVHSDERKFVCEICQKAFKRPDHLNGHMNVHKSVKPFPCVAAMCDKSYCDARSLRRHLEHAHSIRNAVVQSNRGQIMIKYGDLETLHEMKQSGDTPSPTGSADPTGQGLSGTTSTNSRESQESVGTLSGATSIAGDRSGFMLNTHCSEFSVNEEVDRCHSSSVCLNEDLPKGVPCAQCGKIFRNLKLLASHLHSHTGCRSSCPSVFNGQLDFAQMQSAQPPVTVPLARCVSFQPIPTTPLNPPPTHLQFHSGALSAFTSQNNPVATTPPFFDPQQQQHPRHAPQPLPSQNYFGAHILMDEVPTCSANTLAETPVSHCCLVDPLLDLGPDLAKDVDDELINKELEFLYNNNNNVSVQNGGDILCCGGDPMECRNIDAQEGHHNPLLDQFMRDNAVGHYFDPDDEDGFFASPGRKRHMTAPSALGMSTAAPSFDLCDYEGSAVCGSDPSAHHGTNCWPHQPDARILGGLEPWVSDLDPRAHGSELRYSGTVNEPRPINPDQSSHHGTNICPAVSCGTISSEGRDCAGPSGIQAAAHIPPSGDKPKTRPVSRMRRKSRGKPDNVFMLLSSALAKKQFQLSISPVRFRKQRFRPVTTSSTQDHAVTRPAPLIIPAPPPFNRFHSQLRSPRLWIDPHSSSSSSGGGTNSVLCCTCAPYTPPPILSPVRKGSGLFWRLNVSMSACFSGIACHARPAGSTGMPCGGPKSAPISPKFRQEFWKKALSPPKDKVSPEGSSTTSPIQLLDADSQIPETDATPHINVGFKYQAYVEDELTCVDFYSKLSGERVHQADLMFDPLVTEDREEDELDAYMEFSASNGVYGSGQNKEYALHLLHCTRGDIEKSAILIMDPKPEYTNYPGYTYVDSDLWTNEQIQQFQDALFKHDKDFFMVATAVESKTVKQCVAFYYTWKKIFGHENRRLKLLRRRRDLPESLLGDQNASGPKYFLRANANILERGEAAANNSLTPNDSADLLNPVENTVAVIRKIPVQSAMAQNTAILENGPFTSVQPSDFRHLTNQRDDVDFDFSTKPEKLKFGSYANTIEGAKTKRSNTNRDGLFPCKLCDRIFYKIKSRNAHMKSHSTKVKSKDDT